MRKNYINIMDKVLISVFTPTYNRAKYLTTAFESLKKSTFKNFEWVIADDGSTDDTQKIVEAFISESDFPIRYFRYEHGGKMRTMNSGVQECIGKFFFELDSDDEIASNGLELLLNIWRTIENEDKYYCVVGRCLDVNNKLIGEYYPDNFNEFSVKTQNSSKFNWACMSLIKLDILKKYPFPLPVDCDFIPEAVVWRKIAIDYRQWYTNEICYIYHRNEDEKSLTSKKPDPRPTYWYYIYFFNNIFPIDKNTSIKEYLVYAASLCHGSIRCGYKFKRITSDLNTMLSKTLCFFAYVPVKILYFVQKNIMKIDI